MVTGFLYNKTTVDIGHSKNKVQNIDRRSKINHDLEVL